MLQHEIDFLRAERDSAQEQAKKLAKVRLSVEIIRNNDAKCKYYTSLSWSTFLTVFDFVQNDLPPKGIPIIPYIDQLFLTLIKLKHNPKFEFLADRAGISTSTMIDYFWKWVDRVFIKLKFMISWPEEGCKHRHVRWSYAR